MKYSIAVVDKDELYLGRMSRFFSEKYADKVTLYAYSNMDMYMKGKSNNHFDLAVYAEGMVETEQVPMDVSAVFFVSQSDIDKLDGYPAICKYQKHEVILKQLLDICLEKDTVHYTKRNVLGNITKVFLVTAAQGGVGTTTIATAASRYFAAKGHKVLYLSLEQNAVTDLFFQGMEDATFSDVIYTLKSKKSNMIARVENIVQKDDTGVYFFKPCRTVFDMNELTDADTQQLLQEICALGSYEYIVIDSLLKFDETGCFLCDYADDILLVSDANRTAKMKLEQLKQALRIWDSQKGTRYMSKSNIIYNKIDRNSQEMLEHTDLKVLGFMPKYDGVNEKQIAEQLSSMPLWEAVGV